MKTNNSNLSFEEVKKLVETITKEESQKYGINIDCKAISPIYIYKENLPLKTKLLTHYKSTISLYSYKGITTTNKSNKETALVFLNRYKTHIFNTNNIFDYLNTTYHEIRHILQENVIIKPDINRISIIMQELTNYNSIDYLLYHDSFTFEIDSIEYALNMSEKFLKDKNLYNENINAIENKKTSLDVIKLRFNLDDLLTKFDENIKKHKSIKKIETNKEGLYLINAIYNNDFSYKTINEIITNKYLKMLDNQTRYSILSSDVILESIKNQTLTNEEKEELEKAYEYYYQEQEAKLVKIESIKQRINFKKMTEKPQEKIKKNIYNKVTKGFTLIELYDEKDYITKKLKAKQELFYSILKNNKIR